MMFTRLESYENQKNTAKTFVIEVMTKQGNVIESSSVPIELLEQGQEDFWQALEGNGLYYIWNNGSREQKHKRLTAIHVENIAYVTFKLY